MDSDQSPAQFVEAILAAAGLSLAAPEREALRDMYELFRPAVDALYAVPDARYESSALTFRAAPPLEPWRRQAGR